MRFLIIIGTLCILLDLNAETRLHPCQTYDKFKSQNNLIFPYGVVCTKISCDWRVDSTCKKGTYSEVLKWETDIFEIGFKKLDIKRPREIVIKIDLNDDYYLEIKVNSDKKKRTVKVIFNECSHTGNQCFENRNLRRTHDDLDINQDETFVAIGFRKDKKMNFAAVSKNSSYATNLFGPDNEYEFKMSGFYFNTDETMKITVSSKFEKNYKYDGLAMYLSTSVGGMFFNEDGYLFHNDFRCYSYYKNPNYKEGLPYIIREYLKNSENWRAPPVKWTLGARVPYFDEDGMKVGRDQMFVKEVKNPNFDETKMIRIGCIYVDKPDLDTEPDTEETTTTTESTSTEEETKETTTTKTTLMEDEAKETTILDDLKKKSVSTIMPPFREVKESLSEEEIRINQTIFIPKVDPSDENINLKDFIDRVGNDSLDQNFLKTVGKGVNDLKNVILFNGTPVDLSGYKFKDPNVKKKKKETDNKKTTKQIGGSGGAGDASRGEKQVKIISSKYFVILILMILSM